MKENLGLLIAIAVLVIMVLTVAKTMVGNGSRERPRPKAALTHREQAMYYRLTEALPECNVLAQVAFSALLTAKAQATRNTFDKKAADFVIFDKAFKVIAIIELDDNSHKHQQARDAKRDEMLRQAGYTTLRFNNVPDRDQLVKAIKATPMTLADTQRPNVKS
jgi:very-short-patch-repair endonuclease